MTLPEEDKRIDMLNDDIKEIKGDVKDLTKNVSKMSEVLAGNYVQKSTCDECQKDNNDKLEKVKREIKNNYISLLVLIFGVCLVFAGILTFITKSVQLSGWVLSIGSISIAILSIVVSLIRRG